MNPTPFAPPPAFHPGDLDAAGVLTYIHVGDLHFVAREAQNHRDLLDIVQQLNLSFAAYTSFVYLPGDNADHGDVLAYAAVREALDQVKLPWCAIVGDHDVHEKSHANFQAALSPRLHYSFTVGTIRFLALNAFDVPEPPSFSMLQPQLDWIAEQLADARRSRQHTVLLMHCYPGDLKQGREAMQQLVRQCRPLLIDMGHTHYNELANDGHTLYASTRSTGQIEEGPVGFSVTCLDCGSIDSGLASPSVSWRFFSLSELEQGQPAVLITSPADAHLTTASTPVANSTIRACVWSSAPIATVTASIGAQFALPMRPIAGSNTWTCDWPHGLSGAPARSITVTVTTVSGQSSHDTIELTRPSTAVVPAPDLNGHEDRYAIGAWPEHGLLGTQLGPNKNGRKW